MTASYQNVSTKHQLSQSVFCLQSMSFSSLLSSKKKTFIDCGTHWRKLSLTVAHIFGRSKKKTFIDCGTHFWGTHFWAAPILGHTFLEHTFLGTHFWAHIFGELSTYRQAAGQDAYWDGFSEKEPVRDMLLTDQGYLCCYCMRRIDKENMKVEHYRPQSLYPKEELVWKNLLAVCKRE